MHGTTPSDCIGLGYLQPGRLHVITFHEEDLDEIVLRFGERHHALHPRPEGDIEVCEGGLADCAALLQPLNAMMIARVL